MRKGQIKNHGYSLTVKLCRYSPQVLLSLPTSISECCCLSEKKKKKYKTCTSPELELESFDCVHISFVPFCSCFFFFFSFNMLTFKTRLGKKAFCRSVRETHIFQNMLRCTNSLLDMPAPTSQSRLIFPGGVQPAFVLNRPSNMQKKKNPLLHRHEECQAGLRPNHKICFC